MIPLQTKTIVKKLRTFCNFLKIIYLFLDRGKGRERGRETSVCGCLSHRPLPGTWPTTQTCALTGNRTGDPLICELALNPLSHTSQGGLGILGVEK